MRCFRGVRRFSGCPDVRSAFTQAPPAHETVWSLSEMPGFPATAGRSLRARKSEVLDPSDWPKRRAGPCPPDLRFRSAGPSGSMTAKRTNAQCEKEEGFVRNALVVSLFFSPHLCLASYWNNRHAQDSGSGDHEIDPGEPPGGRSHANGQDAWTSHPHPNQVFPSHAGMIAKCH